MSILLKMNQGCSRGFIILKRGGQISTFCRVKAGATDWKRVVAVLRSIPDIIRTQFPECSTPQGLIQVFLYVMLERIDDKEFFNLFQTYQEDMSGKLSREHQDILNTIYEEIHHTEIYRLLLEVTRSNNKYKGEIDTITYLLL
jgi:hypothetical protein